MHRIVSARPRGQVTRRECGSSLVATVFAAALCTATAARAALPAGAMPANPALTAPMVPTTTLAQAAPAPAPVTAPATAPAPAEAAPADPFAFADWTWLNGNPRQKTPAFDSQLFTLELRVDTSLVHSFNNPKDHTDTGSAEIGRVDELQLQQFGIGGDFHWHDVRARLMTQFGVYSELTPRNDASPARGQFNLADMYRYISEAYGGYHIHVLHGINIDAGIFMSYVGLFSYYNYDNWAYLPSYLSSNTPWFFEGVRIQIFPTDRLKIEPWIINGWQSYGVFNNMPGLGFQILWRPTEYISLLSNDYFGTDTLANPGQYRVHTDNSATVKYYENPNSPLDRLAFSLTADFGCETGGGATCNSAQKTGELFSGVMLYNRFWFNHDMFGLTLGGGWITNPGLYLSIIPAINGATAAAPPPQDYFNTSPGRQFQAWDCSLTFDYMPVEEITFRFETGYRQANIPYFAGPNGITPPGGNNGNPTADVPDWKPDLVNSEARVSLALMVKL